jgi:hypothetical protein
MVWVGYESRSEDYGQVCRGCYRRPIDMQSAFTHLQHSLGSCRISVQIPIRGRGHTEEGTG